MLSPVEYYDRYNAITVPSFDGQSDLATGIRVDHYRLGAQQAFIDERFRLGQKIQKDLKIRRQENPQAGVEVNVHTPIGMHTNIFAGFSTSGDDQLWALIRYPYVGKGSPESIQIALQLAAADLPGSAPLVTPGRFQEYCDRWFGLDCNGLVGNYLRHEYAGIHWSDVTESDGIGPDDLITDIWEKFEGEPRGGSSQIKDSDLNVMAMVDQQGKIIKGGGAAPGHIVISGPGEGSTVFNLKGKLPGATDEGVPAICVVESTGAVADADGKSGLVRSFYACIESQSQPGVFRCHRGLNGSVISMRVKGAPWNP